MPPDLFYWLFPAGLVLAVLGIGAMGHVTGWRRLARGYGKRPAGRGQRIRQSRIWFGATRYRNLVVLHADDAYLHFSVWLRIGHPPFSVPWGELAGAYETFGLRRVLRLHARAVPGVGVRLTARSAERLLAASAGRLRVETGQEAGN